MNLSPSMIASRERSLTKSREKKKSEFEKMLNGGISRAISGNKLRQGKLPKSSTAGLKSGLKTILKARKCRQCKTSFTPIRPLQTACSIPCGMKLARKAVEKQDVKKWKGIKEKLKTLSDYEATLQTEINRLVRLIDERQPCISCGGNGKPAAGHYHSRGANRTLRFHLMNLFKQCWQCNERLSGNVPGYDRGLIKIFGNDIWEEIKFTIVKDYPVIKWSKDELKTAIKTTRQLIKEYRPQVLNVKDRISTRRKYNKIIGIYK